MFDLTGRKATVTGRIRRLGHSMAEGLVEAGAEVVTFGSSEKVRDVATQFCNRRLKCHGIAVDLGDSQVRTDVFAEAVGAMGGLGILVNCAGIQRRHKSEEFPFLDWETVMNINLTAPFELYQMVVREFMAKEKPGKIINISSILTFFGGLTVPAYAASKETVAQITKASCNGWVSRNINVNCTVSGYMDTGTNTALTDLSSPRYVETTNRIPAHRWGTPEDTKGAVTFSASPASDCLNGAVIPVDGGYLVE